MSDPQDPDPDPGLFQPPPAARGMMELDREVFTQTVWVPALRVPTALVNKALKSLKKVTLQRPGLKRVADDTPKDDEGEGGGGAGPHRLVLLDPQLVSSSCSFGPAEASALKALGVCADLHRYELRLTYEQLKSEEVLRSVLPEGQDVTSGFSRVGHIAHVNLRDHQLPYKQLIGQVIMDKNPGVTCVVNKTNTIDSTYRNFQMEVLAGESNMVVKVKENGITYEFDFSRVYWNPRLSTEHERLAALLRPGDVVVDVFAGVGPFSVPAARNRRCLVLANDLNPEAHRWLRHNAKINKVESKIELFNLDGREFIRGPVRKRLPTLVRGQGSVHVIMNLPALAPEFLDAFRGLLGDNTPVDDGAPKNVPDDDSDHKNAPDDKNGAPENAPKLPQVHCYGFWKAGDPRGDVVQRAEASLGVSLQGRCSVHMVRNVAPNKEMMCVSFTMPREVLYGRCRERDAAEEPSPKRQRCEETL